MKKIFLLLSVGMLMYVLKDIKSGFTSSDFIAILSIVLNGVNSFLDWKSKQSDKNEQVEKEKYEELRGDILHQKDDLKIFIENVEEFIQLIQSETDTEMILEKKKKIKIVKNSIFLEFRPSLVSDISLKQPSDIPVFQVVLQVIDTIKEEVVEYTSDQRYIKDYTDRIQRGIVLLTQLSSEYFSRFTKLRDERIYEETLSMNSELVPEIIGYFTTAPNDTNLFPDEFKIKADETVRKYYNRVSNIFKDKQDNYDLSKLENISSRFNKEGAGTPSWLEKNKETVEGVGTFYININKTIAQDTIEKLYKTIKI